MGRRQLDDPAVCFRGQGEATDRGRVHRPGLVDEARDQRGELARDVADSCSCTREDDRCVGVMRVIPLTRKLEAVAWADLLLARVVGSPCDPTEKRPSEVVARRAVLGELDPVGHLDPTADGKDLQRVVSIDHTP